MVLGGKGERKNMYRPYLKDGFKLFLLTGGRREEIVDLKWNDIYEQENGTKFFMFHNLKVERILNSNNSYKKFVPINEDLYNFLLELGYDEKKYTSDYILFPERKVKSTTIMNDLSKSFTHYKNGAGIQKDISLKSLRKTYISWVNQVMGNETGLLTSHANNNVIERYYLDPKILSAIEVGSMKIRVFGQTSSRSSSRKIKKDLS
jgi:integrase